MSPEPPRPYAKDRVPAGATLGCGTGVRGDSGLTSWELGLPARLGFSFLYLVKKGKKETSTTNMTKVTFVQSGQWSPTYSLSCYSLDFYVDLERRA